MRTRTRCGEGRGEQGTADDDPGPCAGARVCVVIGQGIFYACRVQEEPSRGGGKESLLT